MSLLSYLIVIALTAVVTYFLTPKAKAEATKVEADVSADVATVEADVKKL